MKQRLLFWRFLWKSAENQSETVRQIGEGTARGSGGNVLAGKLGEGAARASGARGPGGKNWGRGPRVHLGQEVLAGKNGGKEEIHVHGATSQTLAGEIG